MNEKQNNVRGGFLRLWLPVGALGLGVAVFAGMMSLSSQAAADEANPPTSTIDWAKMTAPVSAKVETRESRSMSLDTDRVHEDSLLPLYIGEAAASTASPSASRAGGEPGAPCLCDSECAGLNVADGCLIGVCDLFTGACTLGGGPCNDVLDCPDPINDTCDQAAVDALACAQQNAPNGTRCDRDADFCTLDRCDSNGNCEQEFDTEGAAQTPCTQECVGGTRPGLFCDDSIDCPGGGVCQIKAGGVCNSADGRCETAGDKGRCCQDSLTNGCEFIDETTCLALVPAGSWDREGNPTNIGLTCRCPKYGSGIAPEGTDESTVGPVLQSNFVCALGENVCEGNGSADCQGRCNGGDLDGGICQNDNPDCALVGTCSTNNAVVCLVDQGGTDCPDPGNATCNPSNPGICDADSCVEDPDACSGGFLNIGDDYSITNGSFLRVNKFTFRGGIADPGGVLVFEFHDDSTPTLLVDAFAVTLPLTGTETWTITLDCFPDCIASQGQTPRDPPFIIPPNGHIRMRSSRIEEDAAVGSWVSTTDPADVGLNDPTRMVINDDTTVNHLGNPLPNILSFELVGTKVEAFGACCDPEGIEVCADTPIYECGTCADGVTPCSTRRDCGPNDFCLFDNFKGPISHEEYLLGEGKLCNTNVCTSGACCNPTTGICEELDPTITPCEGNFLGLGTNCEPNCCPNDAVTGADCACDTFQCTPDGGATFDGDCTVGGVADCVDGETCDLVCSGPTPIQIPLPFQCRDPFFQGPLEIPDGVFHPCEFGAVGDALCDGLEPGSTCVEPLFDSTSRVTFSGDSDGANFGVIEGDSCALDAFDPSWHEAFVVKDCAVVTVDFCCTPAPQGIKTPVWIVIADGCPCGTEGGQILGPDTNDDGLRGGFGPGCNTAAGCCADGNIALTFTVPAGTYTWQIAAGGACGGGLTNCDTDDDCQAGDQCILTTGPYTGHFNAERCELAACCNGESCSITDRLACEAGGGDWLGGVDQPVNVCLGGASNVCLLGSCCTGPGACEDDTNHNTLSGCTAAGAGFVYHGGVVCDADPCPVCDFLSGGNCKTDQNSRFIVASDRALVGNLLDPEGCPAFTRRAENFRPGASTIERICYWIGYFNPFDGVECSGTTGGTPPPDEFFVRFYDDDGGLPGLELGPIGGEPLVIDAKRARGGNSRVWEFTSTLSTPIDVNPGGCYWIEITGTGDFDGTSGCVTYLLESLEGDGYGMDDDEGSYGPEDASFFDDNPISDALKDVGDLAYCVSSGLFSNEDCIVQPVCCECDGTKSNKLPIDCHLADGILFSGDTILNNVACPPVPANDNCAGAIPICAGGLPCKVEFDNRCATDDGDLNACFSTVGGIAGIGDEFVKDIWYTFIAPNNGTLVVDTCHSDPNTLTVTNYDTMLAIYEGGADCSTCPTGLLPCGDGFSDDPSCTCDDSNGEPGCIESCFGASDLTRNVTAGNCYFIRVGGDHGAVVQQQGVGTLSLSLDVPDIFSPTLAIEQTVDPPAPVRKNKYISIVPGNPGLNNFDIRLTLTGTLVSTVDAGQIGSEWWANTPTDDNNGPPSVHDCLATVGPNRPTNPPSWVGCPIVHLTGCAIIPTATYDIVAIDGLTVSDPPLVAETQLLPVQEKWWGDAIGLFNGVNWTAPQGTTNFDDVTAALKTFQAPEGLNATHVSWTDVHPNRPDIGGLQVHPNKVVNIDDVFSFIKAFQGDEYPGGFLEGCTDP